MAPHSSDRARSTAIEQLEALGLSSYAARTYVALVRLGDGTAQDVSDVSDVPRTRVYDAVEDLRALGFVDVQQSTPKRFFPVSTETTGRHFEQEYRHRVDRLVESLGAIEPAVTSSEQRGVWTVTGHGTVSERIADFVDSATDEVVFMSVGALLTDDVVDSLRAASERGVTIRLAEMADSTEATVLDAVPEAEPFDSLWVWSDTPAGRLLMVDQSKTLVSVLVPEVGDRPTESEEETAIWGSGETNSLVVVLRAIFAWQLDRNRD